jgi:hypothetical protein
LIVFVVFTSVALPEGEVGWIEIWRVVVVMF